MAEIKNTIDLLGDDVVARMIVEGEIEEFKDNLIEEIKFYAFAECASLRSVNLPSLTIARASAFENCISLTSVNLPLITGVSSQMFKSCKNLNIVDLPNVTNISSSAFSSAGITTLILRAGKVCALANVNAFYKTPFASNGTGGTAYVPAALITEYQNDTNWSTLYAAGTCNFVAIEGSEYE